MKIEKLSVCPEDGEQFEFSFGQGLCTIYDQDSERLKKLIDSLKQVFHYSYTDHKEEINNDMQQIYAVLYDDDDNTLARVHIKEWEGCNDEAVYEKELRNALGKMQEEGIFDSINIVKPYSFVLVDEEKEAIVDLLYVDDDTLILSEDLLEGFDEEMNEFLKHLLED